jgi:hypothetical protein
MCSKVRVKEAILRDRGLVDPGRTEEKRCWSLRPLVGILLESVRVACQEEGIFSDWSGGDNETWLMRQLLKCYEKHPFGMMINTAYNGSLKNKGTVMFGQPEHTNSLDPHFLKGRLLITSNFMFGQHTLWLWRGVIMVVDSGAFQQHINVRCFVLQAYVPVWIVWHALDDSFVTLWNFLVLPGVQWNSIARPYHRVTSADGTWESLHVLCVMEIGLSPRNTHP